MIALITQRQIVDSFGEQADKTLQGMVDYLTSIGFTPVPVPNSVEAAQGILDQIPFNLLVLTGGGFVEQGYYLEACEGAGSQDRRDTVEHMLLDHCRSKGIPVLGICRGMHALNGYFGGKLARKASAYKAREDHPVRLANGAEIIVNSWHDDAVPVDCLGEGLELLATEEKAQTVEAFRTPDKKVLGLQWHPERPLHNEEAIRVTNGLLKDLFES